MDLPTLLARPGLAAEDRLLVIAVATILRADWVGFAACVEAVKCNHQPRQDLEESLLQSILFCGFPRIVTAFEKLAAAWPVEAAPTGGALPVDQQAAAGRKLFASIYGQNDLPVRTMLARLHQELHDFVLEAAYGRILCRPHLAARVRELLAVALLAAQDQPRQFLGHARGAMHLGATRSELDEVLFTVFDEPSVARDWQRRLD